MAEAKRVLVEMDLYSEGEEGDEWVWVSPIEKGPHCHGHGSQVRREHIHSFPQELKIGKYTFFRYESGEIGLQHESGEGMGCDAARLEAALGKFFNEEF